MGFRCTKVGGTGIGLTSTKQVMEAFGGNIKAQLVDNECIEPKVEE